MFIVITNLSIIAAPFPVPAISTNGSVYRVGWDNYLEKFIDCAASILVGTNSPVCIGKTIQLSASGGTSYFWTGPNGFTSILQKPTIINATSEDSGLYSCIISGSSGCKGSY